VACRRRSLPGLQYLAPHGAIAASKLWPAILSGVCDAGGDPVPGHRGPVAHRRGRILLWKPRWHERLWAHPADCDGLPNRCEAMAMSTVPGETVGAGECEPQGTMGMAGPGAVSSPE
jgi:hypothetical protein